MRAYDLMRAAQAQTRDYRIRFLPGPALIRVSCADAGCLWRRDGWRTLIDETNQFGRDQAAYIREQSGRVFREHRDELGLTVFDFDPGQDCFGGHDTRPARALVTHGRSLVREHTRLADMAEDYTEHNGRLADQAQKG